MLSQPEVGVPGAGGGDQFGGLGGERQTGEPVSASGFGCGCEQRHLGVGVYRLAQPVDVFELEEMQGATVDHPSDVAERVEALALLGHRFAAEVDEAPVGAQPVGEEIQRCVDEFPWLLEAPAGVGLGAEIARGFDAAVRPHQSSISLRSA